MLRLSLTVHYERMHHRLDFRQLHRLTSKCPNNERHTFREVQEYRVNSAI